MSKTYTITAALPYTNGPIHIGHLSGVYIPSDIYARFLRIMGNDVLYICGSDEHGVPITIKAKKENTTPQKIVDRYTDKGFKVDEKLYDDPNISLWLNSCKS